MNETMIIEMFTNVQSILKTQLIINSIIFIWLLAITFKVIFNKNTTR